MTLFSPVFGQSQDTDDFSRKETDDKAPGESQDSKEGLSENNDSREINRSNISMDLGVMFNAIKNNGWGLGVTGEYLFYRYFSIYGNFSHKVFFSKGGKNVCTTENIALNLFTYPFGMGLDKFLYLGGGSSVEFIQFTGENLPQDKDNKSAIFIQGLAGWKQPLTQYFAIEGYSGYKWLLYTIDIPEDYNHLLDHGFFFGFKFKVKFGKIYKNLKKGLFSKNSQ